MTTPMPASLPNVPNKEQCKLWVYSVLTMILMILSKNHVPGDVVRAVGRILTELKFGTEISSDTNIAQEDIRKAIDKSIDQMYAELVEAIPTTTKTVIQ